MTWIRRWTLWQAPRGVIAVVWLTFAVAVATLYGLVASWSAPTVEGWVLLSALVLVGDLSDRVKERIGRVIHARTASGAADITVSTDSVWILAAIVTLPVHLVALLAVLLSLGTDIRWRRSRPADSPFPLHRAMVNAAMVMTSSTCGALAYSTLGGALHAPGTAALPVGAMLLGGLTATVLMVVIQMTTLGLITIACGGPVRAVPRLMWSSMADELGLGSLGLLLAVAYQTDPLLLITGIPVVGHLQQSLLHRQLREAAGHDAKTGLVSADRWQERAERTLSTTRSRQGKLGVLLLDLDHFKHVNDTHGHLVGDDVLTAVAQSMRDAVRADDLVGRFGGEEFVILLPGADATRTAQLAERLRLAVKATEVPAQDGGRSVRVTASVGAAVFPGAGWTLHALLEQADRALYAAKRAGRDRVVLSTAHAARRGQGESPVAVTDPVAQPAHPIGATGIPN